MKRVAMVIVPILLAGVVLGYFEVRRKGRELQAQRQAEEAAKAQEDRPVFLADVSTPQIPGADLTTPPAPDADPGMLNPPNVLSMIQAEDANQPGRLPAGAATRLRREGTFVTDLAGAIKHEGGRFVFQPLDNSAPLTLLENQILQRIDYLIEGTDSEPPPARWLVSGQVTEYLGANFLLLRSAVIDRP